jgi:hypothetical protein
MVDRYLATPYLRKKAPPDVAMVPKTTAGMERKKLWLIERNSKAQAKIKPTPAHAGDSQQQETSQRSDSLQPQRALTALEKREMLIQEKAEQIKMKESRLVFASMGFVRLVLCPDRAAMPCSCVGTST